MLCRASPARWRACVPRSVLAGLFGLVAVLAALNPGVAPPPLGFSDPVVGSHAVPAPPALEPVAVVPGVPGSGTLSGVWAPVHHPPRGTVAGSAGKLGAPLLPRPSVGSQSYWSNLTSGVGAVAPLQAFGSSMAYDPSLGAIVLFGGAYISPGSLVEYSDGDTWQFSNGSWSQMDLAALAPSPRWGACMAFDPAEGGLLLFGGVSVVSSGASTVSIWENDTWLYAQDGWTNLTSSLTTAPNGRGTGYCDYDPQMGALVLFGGMNGTGTFGDTWSFSNGTWQNLTGAILGSPPALSGGGMAYDSADHESVLFGGLDASGTDSNGTWSFSNDTWTNLTASAGPVPTSTDETALAYDPALSAVVAYGGFFPPINSTLVFSQGAWKDVTGQVNGSMGSLAATAMAFEPNGNFLLAFGGYTLTSSFTPEEFNATWAFGPAIVPLGRALPRVIDLGQTVNLTVSAVSGFSGLRYLWNGSGCPSANASSVLCTPTATGNLSADVEISDGLGDFANYTFYFRVNPAPNVANFTAIPMAVTVGHPLQFNVTVTGGTSPYRYVYTGLPPNCASRNTSRLACSPSGGGNFAVEVAVADAAQWDVFSNVSVVVNPAPYSANLSASPASLDVGQTLQLNVTFHGGTAPVGFVWSGLPSGCAGGNESNLTCVPTGPWAGTVQVNVTDAFGERTSATASVTVNPPIAILETTSAPAVTDVGIPFTLWVNVTGGTGSPTYAYSGLPDGCGPFVGGRNLCTPTAAGPYAIQVVVTDRVGASATASTPVDVNDPLSVEGRTAAVLVLDLGQNATLAASSNGGTAPIGWAYAGLPSGCASQGLATLVCAPDTTGTFQVTITATDRVGATSTAKVTLDVFTDPEILSFFAYGAPAAAGTPIDLASQVTGGSGGLSFGYTGLPAGCRSENVSNLSCVPTASGHYTVNLTVTDSAGGVARSTLSLDVVTPAASVGPGPLYLYALGAIGAVAVIGVAIAFLRHRRSNPGRARAPPGDGAGAGNEPTAADGPSGGSEGPEA